MGGDGSCWELGRQLVVNWKGVSHLYSVGGGQQLLGDEGHTVACGKWEPERVTAVGGGG
jgi:hypothetical protein